MSEESRFQDVFERLKSILAKFSGELVIAKDESDDLSLNTSHIMKNKKPLFFGAVQIKKRAVTYHLMPVYVFPELLSTITPALKKRMEDKSCFNFKSSDQELLRELTELTEAGYQRYKEADYV